MRQELVDKMATQLMHNLDQTGTSSNFELDAEVIPMILKDIFDCCPFQMEHINVEEIELLIELSSREGERMECELFVENDRLHIEVQSSIGKIKY